MNAFDRLHAASLAAMAGNHEEALQGFLWFHQHALGEQPSLYGVRLSFALARWAELGRRYVPALAAFVRIRDETAERILNGDGGRPLFHDLVAMNEYLGVSGLTYEVYLNMLSTQPALAQSCASLAMPAIIEAGDYQLAWSLLPPADAAIRELAAGLEEDINRAKSRPYSPAPRRWAEIRNFVRSVDQYLTVLRASGMQSEAVRLHALALASIRNPTVRRDVRLEFVRPARAPYRLERRHHHAAR